VTEFLVFAPHIDDEALGCGGVLDARFHVHFLGVEDHHEVDREVRLAEAAACAGVLGHAWSLATGHVVNRYAIADLIGELEMVIARHRPSTVFLPCASYNQDHRATLDAGLVAVRPHDRNPWVANVLLYEEVHVVAWPQRDDLVQARASQPNCLFPIDLERKLAGYRAHASQVRAMRSPELVAALARWRGFQANVAAAEAFVAVRIADPTRLALGLLAPGPQESGGG
jgi:LmbE family N-acetylglucosaminyl deacetylase